MSNEYDSRKQPIIIQNTVVEKPSNGLGTAGFVLSLICFFLSWLPIVSWILFTLGFIFSFVGLFKSPRGLAITGFIFSLINIVIILFIGALILGFAESLFYYL
ncbi:MAG: hypothetical protein FWD47_10380 [Treponema sp.]|nr:hypothetical protein [Treponema sp.]